MHLESPYYLASANKLLLHLESTKLAISTSTEFHHALQLIFSTHLEFVFSSSLLLNISSLSSNSATTVESQRTFSILFSSLLMDWIGKTLSGTPLITSFHFDINCKYTSYRSRGKNCLKKIFESLVHTFPLSFPPVLENVCKKTPKHAFITSFFGSLFITFTHLPYLKLALDNSFFLL